MHRANAPPQCTAPMHRASEAGGTPAVRRLRPASATSVNAHFTVSGIVILTSLFFTSKGCHHRRRFAPAGGRGRHRDAPWGRTLGAGPRASRPPQCTGPVKRASAPPQCTGPMHRASEAGGTPAVRRLRPASATSVNAHFTVSGIVILTSLFFTSKEQAAKSGLPMGIFLITEKARGS